MVLILVDTIVKLTVYALIFGIQIVCSLAAVLVQEGFKWCQFRSGSRSVVDAAFGEWPESNLLSKVTLTQNERARIAARVFGGRLGKVVKKYLECVCVVEIEFEGMPASEFVLDWDDTCALRVGDKGNVALDDMGLLVFELEGGRRVRLL